MSSYTTTEMVVALLLATSNCWAAKPGNELKPYELIEELSASVATFPDPEQLKNSHDRIGASPDVYAPIIAKYSIVPRTPLDDDAHCRGAIGLFALLGVERGGSLAVERYIEATICERQALDKIRSLEEELRVTALPKTERLLTLWKVYHHTLFKLKSGCLSELAKLESDALVSYSSMCFADDDLSQSALIKYYRSVNATAALFRVMEDSRVTESHVKREAIQALKKLELSASQLERLEKLKQHEREQ